MKTILVGMTFLIPVVLFPGNLLRAASAKLSEPPAAPLSANSGTNQDERTSAPSLPAGASTSAPANTNASLNLVTMETLDDKHRLAIGDKLSFRIEEDKYRLAPVEKPGERLDDEPTPLLVTDSGELEVPYIGRFPAQNKTCKQLAYELKAALEKDYFYQATVIVAVDLKAKSRGRVYLNGAIPRRAHRKFPAMRSSRLVRPFSGPGDSPILPSDTM